MTKRCWSQDSSLARTSQSWNRITSTASQKICSRLKCLERRLQECTTTATAWETQSRATRFFRAITRKSISRIWNRRCPTETRLGMSEFIYYSVRLTLKEEKARKLVNSFVEGYSSVAEDTSVVRKSGSFRYRAPFQAFISPNIMNALRNDLKK